MAAVGGQYTEFYGFFMFVQRVYFMVQVIGTFCMDLAIKKAKEVGIGWVTCTGKKDPPYS